MIERVIDIEAGKGAITTFICHPERGGPHPAVLFFMDAPGIREELRDMARRLAAVGYYVMLPNLYYRSGVTEIWPLPADPEAPERRRMMELMDSLDVPMVMDDAAALLAHAKADPAADVGRVGAVGYCMSGRYAINAAARFPGQVKAAASIYGVKLVTEEAVSPHRAARETDAELYFACAEVDRWAPLADVEALTRDLAEHRVRAEVEIYPGVEHGFAFPLRPVYDRPSAERHWERLFALFGRNLAG